MMKLFMLLIGCTPEGRNIEQHDIFFGIGNSVKDLIPDVISFWPEAKGKLHFDAWREVTNVNGFRVKLFHTKKLIVRPNYFFLSISEGISKMNLKNFIIK